MSVISFYYCFIPLNKRVYPNPINYTELRINLQTSQAAQEEYRSEVNKDLDEAIHIALLFRIVVDTSGLGDVIAPRLNP